MASPKARKPPQWFQRAIQTPARERNIRVAGARIHYLSWGKPDRPGLVFIHGGFAHAHWWDFIAPAFAAHYAVAALDLSGMGDSGHRKKYRAELFAREVMAVAEAAGFSAPPILIGHSFGGFVALKTGALHGRQLGGVILADFPIRPPELQQEHDSKRLLGKRKEVYPTLQAALRRFRLIPAQPCQNQFILDHIARRSLIRVSGGWSWKFDQKVFNRFQLGDVAGDLARIRCPLALVYGAKSALFPPAIIRHMSGLLDRNVPFLSLPGAHHHLFLDQPRAFIVTIRQLLNNKTWRDQNAG